MTRSSWNHQKETLIFLLAVLTLFVILIVRNGSSYYMSYIYQDTTRAQFEIDQSYVLLISQAEGIQAQTGKETNTTENYNSSLLETFREKLVEKPNSDEYDFQENGVVEELFRGRQEGFSIFCCHSTTKTKSKASQLQAYGWFVLLMEAELETYRELLAEKHTFSIASAFLSDQMNKTSITIERKILKTINGKNNGFKNTEIQGFPIDFVAKSFGKTAVDWLVLNSNDSFGILKAVIVSQVQINVISVKPDPRIEQFLLESGYRKWQDDDFYVIYYNEQALKSAEKNEQIHDMSPLLEKLRQAKLDEE